jgi:hypothetical protein
VVLRWEYTAVEFQLFAEYQVRDAAGNWHKQRGPHVTWRSGGQSMLDALRAFGADGWEMCGVAPSTKNFACHIVYLKRQLPAS